MPTFLESVCSSKLIQLGCFAAAMSFSIGCDKPESITTYTVPTHESLQSPEFQKLREDSKPKPARMIGAIVPKDSSLWFFKLQGPPDSVQTKLDNVRSFLQTIRFGDDGKIDWTLPEGWARLPGNENRHATLVLSDDPKLEMSVTVLGTGGSSLTEAILNNINRWRGQLDLPHLQAEDLPARTESIKVGETTITLINIVGKAAAKPPMMQEGMSRQKKTKDAGESGKSSGEGKESDSENTPSTPAERPYTVPEGWKEAQPKQFQILRFVIPTEGEKEADVSISIAAGELLANLNRWRVQQLGLEPLEEKQVATAGKPIDVGTKKGNIYEFVAGEKAILGIILPIEDRSMFIKYTGPTDIMQRERSRFEEFAKSLKL